ncbi:MAG: hypothetical protein ACOCZ6_02730 [Nanoarchaeota archaeon]
MNKRYVLFLVLLFILVFSLRIYFALQNPYFSEDEAYFTLRQVEHIKDTGMPIYEDNLSYGGRDYRFLPAYHYIIAVFSLFMPATIALKIVPNLLATSIIIPVYLLINHITKSKKIGLLGAGLASFVPIYIYETINSATVYTLTLPIILTVMYLFLKINFTKSPKWFIIFFIILLLTHPSALLLVLGLLLYLLFAWTEGLDVKRSEIELALFSLFLSVLFYIFFFRDALILHGPSIIFGNIPDKIMNNYFAGVELAETIFYIGIIPAFAAIFVSFLYFSKRKKKSVYLPMSSCFVIVFMLVAKVIPVILGLTYLSIMCTILFGEFFAFISEYLKKTRSILIKWSAYLIIFIMLVTTSLVPSYFAAATVSEEKGERELITTLQALEPLVSSNTTIAAAPENGHLLTYYTKSKNVLDSNYLFIKNLNEKYNNLEALYTSAVASKALEIMEIYDITYIILDKRAREEYNVTKLSYANERCFPQILEYNNTKVYMKKCTLV